MTMSDNDRYIECLQNMYGLRRFGIKLGLSVISGILSALGNPQNAFRCIHVAGTNGKGSIASALATILHACGYKVGLYTSPHLVRFNERICIDNTPIGDEDVVECCKAVRAARNAEREPTFFEYSTAMALYEFARRRVDWAVIETGMGGRLDATNIIKPCVSIITNISLEHRMYLGDTIAQIAAEKAGIIKQGCPVITGVKQKTAWSVIRDTAEKSGSPVFRLGDDFKFRRSRNGTFTYFGMHTTWPQMRAGLSGDHQIENAALVLAACEVLSQNNPAISLPHIKQGLEQNYWPGRLEVVSTSPLIILDGAHNLNAARTLSKFLSSRLPDRKVTLVIGILDDKPYRAMLRALAPVCARAVLTQPKIDRALPPERLLPHVKKWLSDVRIVPDVEDAVRQAAESAGEGDAVCIAGSLYVVGEARAYFEKAGLSRPWGEPPNQMNAT